MIDQAVLTELRARYASATTRVILPKDFEAIAEAALLLALENLTELGQLQAEQALRTRYFNAAGLYACYVPPERSAPAQEPQCIQDVSCDVSCSGKTRATSLTERQKFLNHADMVLLFDFHTTLGDSDADGHTLTKDEIRRLSELGVVQNRGFGHYGVTSFGHWLIDTEFSQDVKLPLCTAREYNDRAKPNE